MKISKNENIKKLKYQKKNKNIKKMKIPKNKNIKK